MGLGIYEQSLLLFTNTNDEGRQIPVLRLRRL